jgi:hypothetical protein
LEKIDELLEFIGSPWHTYPVRIVDDHGASRSFIDVNAALPAPGVS